jgi:ribosomal protein S18 acetylase RimI-like enzyme
LAGLVGVSYEAYRIVRQAHPDQSPMFAEAPFRTGPITDVTEMMSGAPEIQDLAQYAGPDAFGLGAWLDAKLVGACWYWYGNRYRSRGFINLPEHAAKLVQVTVRTDHRGRGIAPLLIARSARALGELGFTDLYARVWHSNEASRAAFRKASWTELGLDVSVSTFVRRRPFRFGPSIPD